VEVLATLLTASEAQVAVLTPCESPDPELCDNQNCHPRACHCNDPLYWRKKCAALTEQVRVLKQNAEDLRDSVLNQRGSLAENGMTNDQVNDVLAEIDYAFSARSAAPGKERGDGK
jgi:hypothetical protein